jgi:nucleotide-binding universal stress UspA family protein
LPLREYADEFDMTAVPLSHVHRFEPATPGGFAMPFKSILVCLNEVNRAQVLLDLAARIAETQSAHVIGFYVVPAVRISSSVGYQVTAQVFESHREYFSARVELVKAQFDETMQRNGLEGEWQLVESSSPLIADPVAERALGSDLIIASQAERHGESGVELDFAPRILMETGRPVLLVPRAGRFTSCGRLAVIGWNSTREAARAAFDAVPMLMHAEAVHVTWVDVAKTGTQAGSLPGAELARALSRHGVTAVAETVPAGGATSGQALLGHAADLGADLLVMGAYGHTRLREFVFGGATRHILQGMTVPVLMSH